MEVISKRCISLRTICVSGESAATSNPDFYRSRDVVTAFISDDTYFTTDLRRDL